jgi:DNA-binding MarR family transcriptional regulator
LLRLNKPRRDAGLDDVLSLVDLIVSGEITKRETQVLLYLWRDSERNGWARILPAAHIGRNTGISGPNVGQALRRLESLGVLVSESGEGKPWWRIVFDKRQWAVEV